MNRPPRPGDQQLIAEDDYKPKSKLKESLETFVAQYRVADLSQRA
jgi:hypothetical protein